MPDAVQKQQAISILGEMGYYVLEDSEELVLLLDPKAPARPVMFDFSKGSIPWPEAKETLENEGINPEAFYSHLEAMG